MKPLLTPMETTRQPVNGRDHVLSARLEHELDARTVELHALRAEMDALVQAMAHDFRGPLQHIGGFAELLFDHSAVRLDDKGRQYVRAIMTSTAKLERMLADFLAYSRLSRNILKRGLLDLGALVRQVVHELASTTGDRQVTWLIEDLPPVRADPALLRQAITHLLANAVKFTQPRAVTRIQIGVQHSGTEKVIFVRDNGVGFDMSQGNKLFEVFQRLHVASAFAGTGLGLASVRRIIERHGGRTWAEGVPGEGAIFYFSLPKAGDSQA